MEVLIIDNEGKNVVAKYEVILDGQNYTPTDEEYYSNAWQCAVDDNIVDNDKRDKYCFSFGN